MTPDPTVSVHLLPSLIPKGSLRGGVAVVIDVLRATTAMTFALAAGIESIRPCLEIDEARALAESIGRDRVILGGERQGLPIEGFDSGNSPSSYTREMCRGKTLVMTTTNGTRALHASLEAEAVLVASFPVLSATVGRVRSVGLPVHIVCAGTDGEVSLEDTLLAGAIVRRLDPRSEWRANDSALVAVRAWDEVEDRAGGLSLHDTLARGRGGRRVAEIGLAADLIPCASPDILPGLTGILRRDPDRIVAEGQGSLF